MVKDDAKDQDSPPCNGAMAFSLKGYRKDLTQKKVLHYLHLKELYCHVVRRSPCPNYEWRGVAAPLQLPHVLGGHPHRKGLAAAAVPWLEIG